MDGLEGDEQLEVDAQTFESRAYNLRKKVVTRKVSNFWGAEVMVVTMDLIESMVCLACVFLEQETFCFAGICSRALFLLPNKTHNISNGLGAELVSFYT